VGDAGGEAADGFEFLGVAELEFHHAAILLGLLLFGDFALEGLVALLEFCSALGDEVWRRSRWLLAWLKRFHFSARA